MNSSEVNGAVTLIALIILAGLIVIEMVEKGYTENFYWLFVTYGFVFVVHMIITQSH